MGFPDGSAGKESTCNAGNMGSMPESGRSPGGGNDNPPQYSCLENPMDRGGWWATVRGIAKSQTRLSRSMDGPLWVKPAQPPLPSAGRWRTCSSEWKRSPSPRETGGNGQRPPNFPLGLHPRLRPQRENHHEVQAATLSHVGEGHGDGEVDKLRKSQRSYSGMWEGAHHERLGHQKSNGSAPGAPEGPCFLVSSWVGWTQGIYRAGPEGMVAGLPVPSFLGSIPKGVPWALRSS